MLSGFLMAVALAAVASAAAAAAAPTNDYHKSIAPSLEWYFHHR